MFVFSLILQVHNEEEVPKADTSPGPEIGGISESHPLWLNSLVGRIFWDFLREKYWTDQVAQKIQKKLSKIKVKMVVICDFFWKKGIPVFSCVLERHSHKVCVRILHFDALNVLVTAAVLHE